MKKIYSLFFIVLSLLILSACNMNALLDNIINEIPNEISEDVELPSTYENGDLAWYLNDELLVDSILKFQHLRYDTIFELKVVSGKKHSTKIISNAKTDFVTDLYVNTNDGSDITSKDDYTDSTLSLTTGNSLSIPNTQIRFRGRGNSTWGFEKKPYRINFSQRESMLGLAPARNYVLLAEYSDKSLMRNYLAHYFAQHFDLGHNIQTRYVNLYLNDSYNGIYLLTENKEVDLSRLNIDTSEDIDGGFLLEFEASYERAAARGDVDFDWFKVNESYYTMRAPKMKDYPNGSSIVTNKINYYKNYISNFESSISKKEYDLYIDVDNFVDYFIVPELFKQVDIGFSSVYIHKDKNEKMRLGPIWDFDLSAGNVDYADHHPQGFWADRHPWFNKLMQQEEFKARYVARFNQVMEDHFDDMLLEIDYVYNNIKEHANRNFEKWDILNKYVWPNSPEMVAANTYEKQIEYLKNYLIIRKDWLIIELNK